MKKSLIVVAVAASFASVAHAQSSVTLYGLLDAGVTYTSNVAHNSKWAAGSGGIDQSRFGLRGSEDLGGGLKAIFTLESGFNVNNGRFANNNGMFNRQAFVGLSSAQFGSVTLGRQYDAAQDFLAPLTATGSWGGTYFAHPFNNDNLNTNGGFAVNNSVKYSSANYAGFTFGGTYGFSNQAGAFANNREYSLGAAYQWQGLRLGAAYAQQNNPGATNAAGTASNGGATDGGFLGATGNFRQREFGAAGSYAFGPATVGLAWTQSRIDNVAGVQQSLRANNYEVNGKYNLTPALGLGVAYTFTDGKGYGTAANGGSTSVRYHQIGLQADYALSRRTDVYAQAVYQHAMGDGGVASIYSGDITQAPSSSKNQTAATVGLRHRF
ncbi:MULTISPECIES: porin [Paraburkholderia]|jgi:predicted porin|uniref:Porin n=2 Tax=Paraburkholderia TaxID=1822464 RepID=A0AB73IDH6_9BURK|nr:porin [Paraburkholderia caledonica]OWJ60931.1 porin [Burkholderia sp. Bk]TCG01960.1 porin [Paraburkholderia strydomiana]MDP9647932.1 putative porin [Paraburkholderia caledonica]MDR6375535.1 putative porin [Paraburkholderia caledonica]CAH2897579.1 MAG: Outer membrane porin [uncultured Paraburkholderia sp.]